MRARQGPSSARGCNLGRIAAAAFAASLAGIATAAGGATAADPAAFATALAACTPATFTHPHPLMKGVQSAHAIEGERDGACRYTQTMPGGMHMECAFDAAQREAFASEFEAMAAGRLAGGTGQPTSWQSACGIVTAEGKRMPLGG